VKKAIIALLVLVGLLVAVDFGVAAAAEQQVSKRMRTELGLTSDPAVRFNGFPFLAQAAQGDYQDVVVTADRLTVGPLTDVSVRAELWHVRIPLGELLGSGQRTLRIDEAEGIVRIKADDLKRQLPGVTDLRIEPVDVADPKRRSPDVEESSSIRLLGKVSLLGQRLDVAAVGALRLDGRTVLIVPRDFEVTGIGNTADLPRPVQDGLTDLFTLRLNPGSLPLTVNPTTLKAVNGALEVSGTAQNLVISGGGASTSGQ
jgi:LmeA-like phospholipid-binding